MKIVSLVISCLCLLVGCSASKPDNVKPVSDFEVDRYLGKWYEIARLNHSFEEGLSDVTATYGERDDGGISVTNKGYNAEEGQWDEAQGKAYFVKDRQTGWLKVSFFGPFYASYVITRLDKEYQWALVTGPDKEYLWLLARTPHLAKSVTDDLLSYAEQLGYDTDKLIFVDHSKTRSAAADK
ncbi:lipocalin family protein [Alteromonas lipotrueiana]|uniref:lipocalin family protein n=1 Tax=Alteromonas lipotrueiana TaxID=2803815 RepID=UPI001C45694F|nr:lipocalin family protein [Alteromonas lipotrueiana]